MSSAQNTRYYTAESGGQTLDGALGASYGAGSSGAATGGGGGSERSVSLSPRPAWTTRLFGGGGHPPPMFAGPPVDQAAADDADERLSMADTIESLRESSVIIRAMPSGLSVDDSPSRSTASPPRYPLTGSPPRGYTPAPSPPRPAPPEASPLRYGPAAAAALPRPAVAAPSLRYAAPAGGTEQETSAGTEQYGVPAATAMHRQPSAPEQYGGGPAAAMYRQPSAPEQYGAAPMYGQPAMHRQPSAPEQYGAAAAAAAAAGAGAAPLGEALSARYGWLGQPPPPPLPVPPATAAARAAAMAMPGAAPQMTASDSWASSSEDGSQQQAQQRQQPLPDVYRPPSAASMQHFAAVPAAAAAAGIHSAHGSGAIPAMAPQMQMQEEKSSPTKSIDASAFHLDAYAGATAEVEEAAARVGSNTQAGGRPSRTAALRQRHLRQLRQQDRDQYGAPVPSTSRPFSLWASPQKIGEACTGLGVYFASVKQFIIAALLLSLVAIYPLANNLVSQKWAASYTLVADQEPLLTCNKGWDTNSWVTGTTAGSRCTSTRYSSSYDCPAVCSWNSSRLERGQCRGLDLPSLPAGAGSNATCLLHPPCSSAGGSGSSDPTAPDGPCYCCDLQLDAEAAAAASGSAGEVPAAQLWVLFLGQLAFLVWVLALTRAQLRAVHKADARVITASDYTVALTGVPPGVGDAELREWCSHYGSLVAAFNIPDAGDAIRVAEHLQTLLIRKGESDAWLCSSACAPTACWFNLCALGASSRLHLQRQLEDAARKLRCYERQQLRPTGTALAVFEYAEHAGNCAEDHHRSVFRRLLDNLLCGATASAPRLASRRVRVRRAPEPSDIIWQHTACTGSAAFGRRLLSAVLTLLIVAAGAFVQYGLAVAAEDERKSKLSALYRYNSGVDGSLDFSSWASFTASALEVTKLNAISILSGLAAVLVNWLVTVAVRKLAVLERWHTRTAGERWALLKLSVAYLTNLFVVPLLAAYFAGSSSSWYSRGGLMESAFFMQAANAVLPPLAVLLDPEDFFYRHIVSRCAKTQAMMNRLLQPPEFLLAEQYASALMTLGVALFWMPVLPISPFIAALGLFLAYWADKIVALRRAAHPGNMRGKLVSSSLLLIRLLPLVQLLLMRFLFFIDEGSMVPVFWAGLAVWLVFAIAPLRMLLGLVPRRRSTVTGGLPYQETLGGGQRKGLDDRYAAELPPCCSPAYHQQVAAAFELLPAPQPATEALLPRQNPATGGAATRPPFRPDRQADREAARAAASLRARQQATLSGQVSAAGGGGGGADGSAPSSSRAAASVGPVGGQPPAAAGAAAGVAGLKLAHALSAVKDSLAEGASWLWTPRDPDTDDLFTYDWRQGGDDEAGDEAKSAEPPATNAGSSMPQGLSPFRPLEKSMSGSGNSGLWGSSSGMA